MKAFILHRYAAGTAAGFLMGFTLIHPFSMVFQGMVHPNIVIDFSKTLDAFSPHHIPMAFFFGVLGSLTGALMIFFAATLRKERERVRALEKLLPICSYCKKIRDDTGKARGEGEWVNVERYISQKTDTDFTHGICPKCFEEVERELNEL
jgi:hypothetical protein